MSLDSPPIWCGTDDADERAVAEQARHALALAQHAQVMEEQARIVRLAQQARNRAVAKPVFVVPGSAADSSRARVIWPTTPAG